MANGIRIIERLRKTPNTHGSFANFQVRWSDADGRHSVTASSRSEANAIAYEIEQAKRQGRRWAPHRMQRQPLLAEEFEYFIDCKRLVLRSRTLEQNERYIALFMRYLVSKGYARPRPSDMSIRTLQGFHGWLADPSTSRHGKGRQYQTIRKTVLAIEHAWVFLAKRDERNVWPSPKSLELPRAVPVFKRRTLTFEDLDAFIDAAGRRSFANNWVQRAAIILRCTGLRKQQAMRLLWSDIDIRNGELHVRPELGKIGQERSGRYVPLSPHLIDYLSTTGQRSGYIISCPRRVRELRGRDASRVWRDVAAYRGVDLEEIRGEPWKLFRAVFQSELRAKGADSEAIKHLVGHSRGVQAHYITPSSLPLADAVALIPPLFSPGDVARPKLTHNI